MKVKVVSRLVNNYHFKIINIENNLHFKVSLINYGAGIRAIYLNNKILNVTPNVLKDFISSGAQYGKTIGRYAGRIEDGVFYLNNKKYQLDLNNGGNCLHGGQNGISEQLFDYEIINNECEVQVKFTLLDKENNFPGDVRFTITYTLFNDKNDILIDYEACSNKDTILNLTNHTYFNLSGDYQKDVKDEILNIKASKFTNLKDNMCLKDLMDVNHEMDFRTPKKIGQDIESPFLQNHPTKGYDHCFILDKHSFNDCIASLKDETSKIRLNVYTSYPCVVVYSCNYPEDKKIYGNKYPRKYEGICFECQYMPNSINYGEETILKANSIYHEKTLFSFIKE